MAISATSSVLTANDWQYAKDIKPGDIVFNRLGQPVRVKTVQTFRSEECYRVMFDDYFSVDGDKNLVLPLEDRQYRKRALTYKGRFEHTAKLKMLSVENLLDVGLTFRETRANFSVPTTEPIQFPHQPLGIPPFIYGFWFFARHCRRTLRVPNEFAEETFKIFKNAGYQIEKLTQYQENYQRFRTFPSIWDQLKGQQTHKIPIQYLNGSPEQRLALIKGILSSKPCKKTGEVGIFRIVFVKKHISVAIQYLAESLGAKTKLHVEKNRSRYVLKITRLAPFLPQMAPDRPVVHLARRYVKSIKQIPAQLCVHIETDEKDGTFLVGEGFISCH